MSSKRSIRGFQPTSITRPLDGDATRVRAAAALVGATLAVLFCTDLRQASRLAGAQLATGSATPVGAGPSTALRAGWREAPEYVELFAPEAHREAYRAYVSPLGLEATVAQLTADPAVLHPPGAWTPRAVIPFDAFGLSGSYNRWKMADLYRSRRASVVRGPLLNQGRMESWTLIAPYPDATLQRLEPGTLVIVLRTPLG